MQFCLYNTHEMVSNKRLKQRRKKCIKMRPLPCLCAYCVNCTLNYPQYPLIVQAFLRYTHRVESVAIFIRVMSHLNVSIYFINLKKKKHVCSSCCFFGCENEIRAKTTKHTILRTHTHTVDILRKTHAVHSMKHI